MSTTEESIALLGAERPRHFESLKRRLHRTWMAMRHDERGPRDYVEDEDEKRLLYGLLREFARKPNGGHGSINGNSSKLGWLVTLNIGITLAVSAWICSTIIEQGKAIAVIECRLNPQCAGVPRGQP